MATGKLSYQSAFLALGNLRARGREKYQIQRRKPIFVCREMLAEQGTCLALAPIP